MNSKNEMFIRLTNRRALAIVPDTFVDLFNASLPLPPYLTTFTDLTPAQVVAIAEIFTFDQNYPRYNEVGEDMSENNALYFEYINTELRDPKWRWNKTISFAAEIDADHARAKWYVAYEALSKPNLVVMNPGTTADLFKKANVYFIKMYKRLKSGHTSTAAAPTFNEAQTQREATYENVQVCDSSDETEKLELRTFKNPPDPHRPPDINNYYEWTTNNPTPTDYSEVDAQKQAKAHRLGFIQPTGCTFTDLTRLNRCSTNPLNSSTMPRQFPINITPEGGANVTDIAADLSPLSRDTGIPNITAKFDQLTDVNMAKQQKKNQREQVEQRKCKVWPDFGGDSSGDEESDDSDEQMFDADVPRIYHTEHLIKNRDKSDADALIKAKLKKHTQTQTMTLEQEYYNNPIYDFNGVPIPIQQERGRGRGRRGDSYSGRGGGRGRGNGRGRGTGRGRGRGGHPGPRSGCYNCGGPHRLRNCPDRNENEEYALNDLENKDRPMFYTNSYNNNKQYY